MPFALTPCCLFQFVPCVVSLMLVNLWSCFMNFHFPDDEVHKSGGLQKQSLEDQHDGCIDDHENIYLHPSTQESNPHFIYDPFTVPSKR